MMCFVLIDKNNRMGRRDRAEQQFKRKSLIDLSLVSNCESSLAVLMGSDALAANF